MSVPRSLVATSLVAVLAVVAGCAGLGITGTPTDTVTPAPVPTATPTGTPLPQFAPGLAPSGVVGVFELSEAHASTLRRTNYTFRFEKTVRAPNGTRYGREAGVVRVDRRGGFRARVDVSGSEARFGPEAAGHVDRWSDGERYAVAVTANGSTRYGYVPPDSYNHRRTRVATATERMFLVLAAVDTRFAGRVERNGTTLYRVEATGVPRPDRLATAESIRDPRNVSFTALVDGRGVVREYRLSYRATDPFPDRAVVIERSVRHGRFGETAVERPTWLPEARATVDVNRTTPGERPPGTRVSGAGGDADESAGG